MKHKEFIDALDDSQIVAAIEGAEKRSTGDWWTRKLLGVYAPVLERDAAGTAGIVAMPDALPIHD